MATKRNQKAAGEKMANNSQMEKSASQIKGKIGEYQFIGELLRRGFDVYLPIADIRGIDCVIRSPSGKYIEIQVKLRVTKGSGKDIFEVRNFQARNNFFIVCKRDDWDKFWIFPSKVFEKFSKFREKYNSRRLILNQKKRKNLKIYEDNFQQLLCIV